MFKTLQYGDISTRKFKVYRNWAVDQTTTGSYNMFVQYGVSGSGTFNSESDAKNADGSYKRLIWASVQHLYFPTSSLRQILSPKAYTRNFIDIDKLPLITRSLDETGIAVLNIPVKIYGEEIKPNSILLVTGSTVVQDDGNYNLFISGSSPKANIGNVFYQYGQLIITSQSYTCSFDVFDLSFKSTHEIYEKEIFCEVGNSEFNYSVNPTAYNTDNIHYIPIFSSSIVQPYITQIGLYNDQNELLVVGKLPRPYRQLDELDTTFVLRFDL